MRRAVTIFALMLALSASGCKSLSRYFAYEDAPDTIKAAQVDPRLQLTRQLGERWSPIIRNMAAKHGRLHYANGLEDHLRSILKPLDIIVVRSRPALTRIAFPSHFTHAEIWLGSEHELRSLGVYNAGYFTPMRADVAAGKTIFEAADDDVHLSPFRSMTNVDEILILRPQGLTLASMHAKYRGLAGLVGEPFDYNFDYGDTSRLTCMEVVKQTYSEASIPVRYTTGRYTVIPDDIARRGLVAGSSLRLVAYVKPEGFDGYRLASAVEAEAAITEPAAKPKYARRY
ncbi:MAG: YiiX/YebB-like N1pC/P60 family cysteine hydrolase [Rhizobiaceae bacterium]